MKSEIDATQEYGVYLIINRINDHMYVGKGAIRRDRTCNRWDEHIQPRKNAKKLSLIQKAIQKYGMENFHFCWLETGKTKEEVRDEKLEEHWIAELQTNVCRYPELRHYNLTDGGEGTAGCIRHEFSEEHKEKLRQVNLGKTRSDEAKQNMREAQLGNSNARGCKHSDESRKNMSQAHRGIKHSDETKRKMSQTRSGRTMSAETKEKIGFANRGRKHSDESRKNMSQSHTGKPLSEETKKKMRSAKTGIKNYRTQNKIWRQLCELINSCFVD